MKKYVYSKKIIYVIQKKLYAFSTEGWAVYPNGQLNYKVNLTPRLHEFVGHHLCRCCQYPSLFH